MGYIEDELALPVPRVKIGAAMMNVEYLSARLLGDEPLEIEEALFHLTLIGTLLAAVMADESQMPTKQTFQQECEAAESLNEWLLEAVYKEVRDLGKDGTGR